MVDEAIEAAIGQVDTAPAQANLGRAVLAARDAGWVDAVTTAVALLDLACSAASLLLRSSLLEALP